MLHISKIDSNYPGFCIWDSQLFLTIGTISVCLPLFRQLLYFAALLEYYWSSISVLHIPIPLKAPIQKELANSNQTLSRSNAILNNYLSRYSCTYMNRSNSSKNSQ